jgi:hypothetical protein
MTTKVKKSGKLLSDYKRVGKRLIPPLKQLDQMVEMSFRDNVLPDLIWISAIFRQSSDKDAVDTIIEFLRGCNSAVKDEKVPALAFLGNLRKISMVHLAAFRSVAERMGLLPDLQKKLMHQHNLLTNYPLDFLFDGKGNEFDRESALHQLKEDVKLLLDRHSLHATKVQTTAMFSMMATGKMVISNTIDLPDFNAIFISPDSDEAMRVAAFVRAGINAGNMFDRESPNRWAHEFWNEVFFMEPCSTDEIEDEE